MKLKKVLASILCLTMVLSTMGTVAFASNTEADVWDGTVDISWYNEIDTEFTITTAEQWAGLAYLVNGAQSFNPALDNYTDADFGYYSEGNKSARPDETAADNSISFEGKTIYLAADLDLRPVDANGELVKLPGDEQLSMMPVGYSSYTPFKGTFDGQGHTIKNLFQGGWDLFGLDYNNAVKLGVFGNVTDATIKNLVVDNFTFNAQMTLGGVAGITRGTSVFENIIIKNSTIAAQGGWSIGGIVGYVYGNPTFNNIDIDKTNTVGAANGGFDASVGGIIGRCDDVDCESVTIKNSNIACKLDVYNDCTASYDTNSYRNCGMVIGGVGENNEITIDGKLYPDFDAKNFTFENVNVTIGEWANYTYCWSAYAFGNRVSQRIEPGVGYKGVDVSTITDASVTCRPFAAIFGAENAGNLNNVRGDVDVRDMEFLGIEGVNVFDEAHLALTAAEVYKYSDITRAATLIYVDGFATLQDAINFIGSDEGEYVIKVLKDIEENVTVTQNANQKITICGDEDNKPVIKGQLTINGGSQNADMGQALVIENLAFDANYVTDACILNPTDPTTTRYASYITINGCDFYGDDAEKVAIRTSTGGSKNWTVSDSSFTGLHSLMQTKGIDGLNIERCTVEDCASGVNLGNSKNVKITGSSLNVADYGVRVGENGNDTGDHSVTLENNTIKSGEGALVVRNGAEYSTINIVSGTYESTGSSAIVFGDEKKEFRGTENLNLTVSGGEFSSSSIDVVKAATGVETNYDLEGFLADGLTIAVNGYGNYTPVADDAGNDIAVTENIAVSLEPTENANKYDVVLKADENTEIHRFLSAELNITLTPDAEDVTPISIKNIVGNEEYNIEVIKPEYNPSTIWGFHLGEVTDITVKEYTGSELTIATIELTGYGEGELTVAAHANNKVQAIQSKDNNDVKFYTVDADTLVLPTGSDYVNLEVPTKDLTIEITFVNPIMDQIADYQDMTVTVEGKDIDTITRKLGEGGDVQLVTSADGKIVQYVITLDDELTENNSYNITVTGAGYRTAEYRVTMTEDKTVYFWNDAKKDGKEETIEIGVSAPVKATFLAGDIAEDNIIDKYDLAAVVSYFGKYNLTNSDATYKYAKYDLNRDGNIDSEDIAYVLASFGY